MDKIALSENSVTVRRRRGGRRFVVPRPGATLSQLEKIEKRMDKIAPAENSVTVRRRRGRRRGGGGRRFVVPRPGATLSHLVKMFVCAKKPKN
jgi:hypothetical protein